MDEDQVKKRMDQVVDLVRSDVGTIRTGKVTPAILEDLVISVYGGAQKLKIVELATISVPEPQTLVLEPWDKSIIGEIKRGIMAANIGVNPQIDEGIIRLSFPSLTTEDREKYVKLLNTKLENGKIMIRQVRADFMKLIKKDFEAKEISEDQKFNYEKRLQELTDDYVGKVDQMGERKKEELLQV
jgi:ribosome recycling factor